jgi:hypothetical protein
MKPVHQTKFGEEGNCFAACAASILEMPIEAMPEGLRYIDEWRDWLHVRGFGIKRYGWPAHPAPADDYLIVRGESPRGFARGHEVVVLGGQTVHDPHPSGDAIGEWWSWATIYPLEETP